MTELVPLTGNASELASVAKGYLQISDALQQAANELSDISKNDKFASDAIVEIRDRSSKASLEMSEVYGRYVKTAGALAGYASSLSDAQQKANAAIANYNALTDEIGKLRTTSAHYEDLATQGGPESLAYKAKKAAVDANIANLEHDLARVVSSYESAFSEKSSAASAAAKEIAAAMAGSKLNDDFADVSEVAVQIVYKWAQKYVAPVLNDISAIAGDVATILTVVALIVSVCGFPEVGAALWLAAKVISVISLAATIYSFLLGGTTLGALIGAGISLVVGKLLGKLAGPAIKLVTKEVTGEALESSELANDAWSGLGSKLFDKETTDNSVFETYVSSPTTGILNQELHLLPSDGGSSWNAPPPIQVDALSGVTMPARSPQLTASAAR